MSKLFTVDENKDGTVNVRNVPIFKAHTDRRYVCDEVWLDRCVADFVGQKVESMADMGHDAKYAMLPPLTEGHTPEDPNAPEPPARGFIDNLRRVGKYLHADLVNVAKDTWAKMKAGSYPYRSAEVIPNKFRLTNVSLLGGRYPHFSLPVMRFKHNGLNVLRYTMAFDEGQEGGEEAGGVDIQALAEAVAPIVAELITSRQAEGAMEDVAEAGAAAPVGYRARNGKSPRSRISRYTEHTSKPANAAEDDDWQPPKGDVQATPGSDGVGEHTEDFRGEKPSGKTMKLQINDPELRRYVSALEEANTSLRTELDEVKGAVGELHRHRGEEARASKRMMIRAKCREIAALGYAIGNSEEIERHVERMMPMAVEDVRSYVDDVLKKAPKIPVQRHHGVADTIRRPGSMDEYERYVEENRETVDRYGLDADILRLSDVLAG